MADRTANVIAWGAAATAGIGGVAALIASRATTPLSHNPWFISCIVIFIISFVVLLLVGPWLVWSWWRGRKKPDAPPRSDAGSTGAAEAGDSLSLRNFHIGEDSDFKLRSSAHTLAEGGGVSGRAKFDAQHFPGHPELFGRAVGSQGEQKGASQAEGGSPGEAGSGGA